MAARGPVRSARGESVSKEVISGFGAALAAAREAEGLDTAEVAAQLKMTIRQIEALEAEDWSRLPGPIFVRGFVRNYARLVHLDPESLVPPVNVVATATKTITAPSAGVRFGGSRISRWALIVLSAMALFLLVVALLYNWLRRGEEGWLMTPPPVSPQASTTSVPAPTPLKAGQAGGAGNAPPSVTSPSVMQPQAANPSSANNGTLASMAVQGQQEAKPAATDLHQAAEKPARNVSMTIEPTSVDAWIQIVDAQGHRFSKLVRAGTLETFSGDPPFQLVVGNAAYVKLTYNGQIIDLTPYIGEKVARLTLE